VNTVGSVSGVSYQLYDVNNQPVGSPQPGDGSSDITWSGLSGGTSGYYVIASNANNCTTSSNNTATIGTNSNPTPTVTETDNSNHNNGNICYADNTALHTGTYDSYLWSTGSTDNPSQLFYPTSDDDYYVTVTDENGCTGTGSLHIHVYPKPDGNLTANGPFCGSGDAQLTFTATSGTGPFDLQYNVSNSGTENSNNLTSGVAFDVDNNPLTTTTTYTIIEIADNNHCLRSANFAGTTQATITVNPLPNGSLSGNTVACGSGTGQFTFTSSAGTGPFTLVISGHTYTNVVSGNPFNASPNPTITTNYTLTSITDANTCQTTNGITGASATITVNPSANGSLSGNTFCSAIGGGQFTYTSSAGTGPFTLVISGTTYTGVVSGTPFNANPNPSSTTNYTLTSITDANTCQTTSGITGASATITVNSAPVFSSCVPAQSANTLSNSCANTVTYSSTEVVTGLPSPTITYVFSGATTGSGSGDGNGSSFNKGTTTVTLTATNTCNTATCSFSVVVTDITPPIITCGSSISVAANTSGCSYTSSLLTSPTASDNCAGSGNALNLNGTNNYFSTPDIKSFFTSSGTMTIELWFNANAPGIIVDELGGPPPSNGWHDSYIEILTGGVVKVRVWSLTAVTVGTVSFGTWHHVALRYNATTSTLDGFLDGVQSASSVSGSIQHSSELYLNMGLTDGQNLGSGAYFNGKIDEVRIWNTARTASQIQSNMNNEFTSPQSGLVVYYKLDQGTAGGNNAGINTATDLSGNNETGTVTNFSLTGSTSNWVTGAPLGLTVTNNATSTLPLGTNTVTWTATDGSGNTATCSQTVTITNPATAGITGTTTACGSVSLTATPSGQASYAWSGGSSIATAANTFTSSGTYTVTVTNANGCSGTTSANVTVNPLPNGSLSGNTVCSGGTGQFTFTSSAGTGPFTLVISGHTYLGVVSGTPFNANPNPSVTTNYTLTSITDANTCPTTSGITGASATITVNSAPTITCLGTQNANTLSNSCANTVTYSSTEVVTGSPTPAITYVFSGATTGSGSGDGSGSSFNKGTTIVTLTATNTCNTATCSFSVVVTDATPPTISCGGNYSANDATGVCNASIVTTNPTTGDNCSAISKLTWAKTGATTGSSANSGINNVGTTTFNTGTTTVTYTVTDGSNNISTCSYTATVTDNQAPSFYGNQNLGTAPTLATTNVTEATNFQVVYEWDIPTATSSGNGSFPYQVNNSGVSGVTFTRIAYFLQLDSKWVWVSFDKFNSNVTLTQIGIPAAGQNSVAFQQIVNNMNVYSSSGAGVTNGTGLSGNVELWTDCYTQATGLSGIGGSSSTFDFNDTRTGGTCYGSFQIHNYGALQTILAYNDFSTGNTSDLGIGNDPTGSNPDWTFAANATSYTTRKLYILVSGAPPNITLNADAGNCSRANVTYNVTATDNCGTPTVTYSPLSGSTFNVGTTTVTATANDGNGNTATVNFTVTIVDNQVPTITCGGNYTANDGAGQCNASVITTNPTTGDNCSVTVLKWTKTGATTGSSPTTGINNVGTATFNTGTTTVTYTAADAANNTSTCSYTVTVTDNIAPTITCGGNYTANDAASQCNASVVTTNPTTGDNCSVTKLTWAKTGVTTGVSASSGINNVGTATFNTGITTVTYTVADAANNTTTCSYTVTISDNQAPTITSPGNQTLNTISNTCAANYTIASPINDNCPSSTSWGYSLTDATSGSASGIAEGTGSGTISFNKGITTVTLSGTDGTNNATTTSFTVTVNDNQAPTITCAAPVTINMTNGQCSGTTALTQPTVSDNCSSIGNALNFDGSNDYVVIPRSISGDFTIEYWMKTTQTGASGGQWYSGTGVVDAEVSGVTTDFGTSLNGSKISFGIGSPDMTIFSTSNVNTGNWVHIAATRQQSSGQFNLYVNGVLEATATGATAAQEVIEGF